MLQPHEANEAAVEWHPRRILHRHGPASERGDSQDTYALIVLNQPLDTFEGLRELWENG